jgi:hypothetical protein
MASTRHKATPSLDDCVSPLLKRRTEQNRTIAGMRFQPGFQNFALGGRHAKLCFYDPKQAVTRLWKPRLQPSLNINISLSVSSASRGCYSLMSAPWEGNTSMHW